MGLTTEKRLSSIHEATLDLANSVPWIQPLRKVMCELRRFDCLIPTKFGRDAQKSRDARPIRLFASLYGGLGVALSLFFISNSLCTLVQDWRLDGNFIRFAMLAGVPFLFCEGVFLALQIITNLSFAIAPVAQYQENSRYYSAIRPNPNPEVDSNLPHVTVELPIYMESLEETIMPSVNSIEKAMQTYALQGGTSNIFVHDDGLQLLGEDECNRRLAFYTDHNIGWVARPPHDNSHTGFKRAGRFKKASNMNYGLMFSFKLEAKLLELEALGISVAFDDIQCLEDYALKLVIEEMYQQTGRRWRPWAGNLCRIGDIILIVDSDTAVPEDCFRDAAREFAECPEVAIIQHESDVMQVAHHYFENGIVYFTRRINKCISMSCANGEVAPFVGHNAFLRWSAIQEAAFVDPLDGRRKIWSESNVSEDMDMALRLQLNGYIIRWATYSAGAFKEGVSLTLYDELNRWQKYAYGCSEFIFNPLNEWWSLGPITKRLRVFLLSSAPLHFKISMGSYMFSYYGIAASALLPIMHSLVLMSALKVDGFYMQSFKIWLACTAVFPTVGSLGYTLLEYRLGHRKILSSLFENLIWLPFFFFFFGGLSFHLMFVLLAHIFSHDVVWRATKKEMEQSNFWMEVPRIWRRFRLVFCTCILLITGTIFLSSPFVPTMWYIPRMSSTMVLPPVLVAGLHLVFPIVLNPWLLVFA